MIEMRIIPVFLTIRNYGIALYKYVIFFHIFHIKSTFFIKAPLGTSTDMEMVKTVHI